MHQSLEVFYSHNLRAKAEIMIRRALKGISKRELRLVSDLVKFSVLKPALSTPNYLSFDDW